MGHFLIKELIETYFIPLAIYNNKSGYDAEVLKKFNETSWNNPVVHITNHEGKDILPIFHGQYSEGQMITYIRKAMQANGKLIPKYLQLLEEEYTAQKSELTLEMYCFWSGEKNIGSQDGVIYTEAGFSNGKEVVKVTYDKSKINAASIIKNAKATGNADAIHTNDPTLLSLAKQNNISVKKPNTYRKDNEVHYYLYHSKYHKLELTPMQATRINSALAQGQSPEDYLSPRQIKLVKR
jgi:copper chaperone CopZ